MAQVDIAGLLTGIPALQSPRMQGRINAANLPSRTPLPYLAGKLEEGRAANQARMRRGLGGLFGRDLRTEGEKAREAVGQATSNLELAQAIQGVAPEQAVALRRLAAQEQAAREQEQAEKDQEEKIKQALIIIAKSQDNNNLVSWLEAGGDSSTAASLLLKQPSMAKPEAFTTMYSKNGDALRTAVLDGKLVRATDTGWEIIDEKVFAQNPITKPEKEKEKELKPSSLSAEELKTYTSIIKNNPDLKNLMKTSRFLGKLDEDNLRQIADEAERIVTNNPNLTKKQALEQVLKIQKSSNATDDDPFSDA